MKKLAFGLMIGAAIGAYVAFINEEELDECCYKAKRARRKMMRSIHHFQNHE